MAEKNIVRILWLSDIHFRKNYQAPVRVNGRKTPISAEDQKLLALQQYLRSFFEVVAEYQKPLERENESIDYVLISGDLAFSGAAEDYQMLNDLIVDPLKKLLSTTTSFLTIPGNHDVWRDSDDFFRHYLSNISFSTPEEYKEKMANLRRDFVFIKQENFHNLFNHYSSYFRNAILPSLNQEEISEEYRKNGLYGLIVNKEKNLVINLFNSAWFALGQRFDTILQREFLRDTFGKLKIYFENNEDWNARENYVGKLFEELITIKNATQEYGEQTMGESVMPVDEYIALLDRHSGAFAISCFHHSPNWIQYSSRYDTNLQRNDQLFYNQMLQRSNIVLTGHEHVPASVLAEKIQRDVVHLKGGMFLQDNVLREVEGEHRFSILEIDTRHFSFSERKYSYDWDEKNWNFDAAHSLYNETVKKRSVRFDTDKESRLSVALLGIPTIKNILSHFFIPKAIIDEMDIRLISAADPDYHLFGLHKNNTLQQLVIVPTGRAFFASRLISSRNRRKKTPHPFFDILRHAHTPSADLVVLVLTPDFLVDKTLRDRYIVPGTDMVEVFSEIVKKGDFIFNVSRHSFFSEFQSSEAKNKWLKINGIGFSDIKEIRFSNQVIPFWSIERYLGPD